MPIRVNVDETRGLIEMVFTGTVTAAEAGETLDRYLPGPYAALPLGLFDASGLTATDVSVDVVREAARRASENVDSQVARGRLAIVASSEISQALGRIYEILRRSSPVEVAVFGERREAERWLGLGDDGSGPEG